jgi:two-component system CheB/CheR fusion protein
MAAKKKNTKRAKAPKKPDPPRQPTKATEQLEEAPASAEEPQVRSRPEKPGAPVAGIGASAGGLDAFKKFFAAMPPDSGIAFVLVPHLDPAHESLMVELLARHTTMPVVEAENDMPVEANHVYIIPPNKYMTIHGGILRLTGPVERRTSQTSIDLFLRSLADDQQERSICIILSGTGSHGALGLKAVKAAGGIAMVQDPETAEYERMPQSAIATGLADYILPAEQMPDALVKYVKHAYVNGGVRIEAAPEAADHLTQVLALLRTRGKFDFRAYRKKMLTRRIERRMGLNHFDSIPEYMAFLRDHPEERKHLVKDLFISVTSFFRDSEAFQALATQVIVPLVESKEADAAIRVWVPGCATGEEPYAIAMLLQERLAAAQKNCRTQIFATDVDEDALAVARQGLYPDSIAADVAPERLTRFFTKVDDHTYQVNKQVRETVTFAAQNLISDAPFTKLDLISCRNLLIYLEPDVQKKVVTLFHFALNEKGFLFLGSSETIGRQTDLFEPLSKKWRTYRRIGPSRPARVDFPIVAATEARGTARHPAEPAGAPTTDLAEVARRLLLEEFAPAAVLINRKYEIFYYFGPCAQYLEFPTGQPTHDLSLMAREGLRTKLRGAAHRAVRDNESVVLTDVQVRRHGGYHPVHVTVRPVHVPKAAEGLLLVTFADEVVPAQPSSPVGLQEPAESRENIALRQLEYELKATREDLQSTVEEMESSNEELKASNEEIMSMNEELQSANEELETSKEELQSLNEELSTVNNQLQEKVDELEKASNDMANLLQCTDIATVFLDAAFRINLFTPAATKLFNLIASDTGRPLGDITLRFDDPSLLGDAQQVLHRLVPLEKEVSTTYGSWWIRRILPYRTRDNRIDGVVITFVDITERKRAADVVARRLAAIVESSADAIFSKDLAGVVGTWNQGAERVFGFTGDEIIGRSIRATIPDDHAEEWSQAMARLARGESVEQMETERMHKDGRCIPIVVTYSPIRNTEGKVVSVSAIARDITERKRAEEALRENEKRLAADLAAMTRLQEVSTRLVQAGDSTSLLLKIVDAAIALTAADMGNIQLLAPGGDALQIVASRGFERPYLEFFNAVHEGEAACGAALRKRERVVVEDVTTSPIFVNTPALDVQLAAGVRAVQTTPLFSRAGRLVGMLSTHYRAPHRPADCDLRVLDLLARQAADWIERTENEKELQLQGQVAANLAEGVGLVRASDSIIVYTNERYEKLFGYAPGEMLGRHVSVLNAGEGAKPAETAGAIIRTLRQNGVWTGEVHNVKKDGTPFWSYANVSTFKHPRFGTVWIGALTDITDRKRAEEALRDREERLRAILDTAMDAIITIDGRGIIQSVNSATEEMFGYTAAEMVGQNVTMLMSSPDREAHDDYMARYLQSREKHIIGIRREVEGRRKDGSVFPTDLAVREIEHLGLFTGIHRDLTDRKKLEREVVEVASLEQRRIGQDLHDSVAQELTALNLLAKDLAETFPTDPAKASELTQQIRSGLKRSQQGLRTVLRGLLPVSVDSEGLMAALADLAERIQQEGKVTCTFDCPESVSVADNVTATHAYLIAQEAVHNAVKHAQAKKVRIGLTSNDRMVLSVQDDGIGMPAEPKGSQGLGLRIMRNRAAIIGAMLTIEPAKPTGTVVACTLARRNNAPKQAKETQPRPHRR